MDEMTEKAKGLPAWVAMAGLIGVILLFAVCMIGIDYLESWKLFSDYWFNIN